MGNALHDTLKCDCTNNSTIEINCVDIKVEEECFKDLEDGYKYTAFSVCILVAIIGIVGNLLTIIALPMQKKLRQPMTYFVINLAVADLLYCMTSLPANAYSLINPTGMAHKTNLCAFTAFLRYFNAFSDWASLAVIAVERCVRIVYPEHVYHRIFSKRNTILLIASLWSVNAIILIPTYLKKFGEFGFNCILQRCDFLPNDAIGIDPRPLAFAFWPFLAGVIIVSSYVKICIKILHHRKLREDFDQVIGQKSMKDNEMRLAMTAFMVFCTYVLCVLPVSFVNLIDICNTNLNATMMCYSMYWFQYCVNNLIYAARIRCYRKAYIQLLSRVFGVCCFRGDDCGVFLTKTSSTVKPVQRVNSQEVTLFPSPFAGKDNESMAVSNEAESSSDDSTLGRNSRSDQATLFVDTPSDTPFSTPRKQSQTEALQVISLQIIRSHNRQEEEDAKNTDQLQCG